MDKEVKRLLEDYNTEFVKFRRTVEDALENIDLDNLSPRVKSLLTENGAARAGFETGSTADGAFARMFAEYKTAQAKTLAEFKAEVAATYATASMLAEFQSGMESSIASIQATADANQSSINSLTSWKSTVDDNIDALDKDIQSVTGMAQTANASGAFINLFALAGGGELEKDDNGNFVLTNSGEYILVNGDVKTPISSADVAGMFISKLNSDKSEIKLRADLISLGDGVSVTNDGKIYIKRIYSEESNGFYLKIGTTGDIGLYQYSAAEGANPKSSDCAFGVYHDFSNAINLYCYGEDNNFFGYNYNQHKAFPKGAWDFSVANVSGLAVYFS